MDVTHAPKESKNKRRKKKKKKGDLLSTWVIRFGAISLCFQVLVECLSSKYIYSKYEKKTIKLK